MAQRAYSHYFVAYSHFFQTIFLLNRTIFSCLIALFFIPNRTIFSAIKQTKFSYSHFLIKKVQNSAKRKFEFAQKVWFQNSAKRNFEFALKFC